MDRTLKAVVVVALMWVVALWLFWMVGGLDELASPRY
jgi:hypothetical protein